MVKSVKIAVERHPDNYVAYALEGAKGVVIGDGDTCESALANLISALRFDVETFGTDALD